MRLTAIVGLLFAALAFGAGAARVSPALRLMAARREGAHPLAGVPFPQRSAGFVRTEVIRFDREGLDVAANYAMRGYSFTRILATFYVYPVTPTTADLAEEFGRRRRELEAAKPATFVAEREVRLGRGGLEARYAAYALESGTVLDGGPEQTVLVIARWGSWWIKWRVTAPDNGDGLPRAVMQLIEELTPSQDPPTRTDDTYDSERLAWAPQTKHFANRVPVKYLAHCRRRTLGRGASRGAGLGGVYPTAGWVEAPRSLDHVPRPRIVRHHQILAIGRGLKGNPDEAGPEERLRVSLHVRPCRLPHEPSLGVMSDPPGLPALEDAPRPVASLHENNLTRIHTWSAMTSKNSRPMRRSVMNRCSARDSRSTPSEYGWELPCWSHNLARSGNEQLKQRRTSSPSILMDWGLPSATNDFSHL